MVATRTLLSSLLLPMSLLSQSVQGSGLFERDVTGPLLQERAAINGDICVELDLTLVGIPLANDVCICARAGLLTDASAASLGTAVTDNGGLLAPIFQLTGGLAAATTQLVSETLPFILQQTTGCVYPAGSTPTTCGTCDFVCDEGLTESGGACCSDGFVGCNGLCVVVGSICCPVEQVLCNGACVDSGTVCCPTGTTVCGTQCIAPGDGTCVSNIVVPPVARRGLNSASCPFGFESCKIPGTLRNFECINTASDLESCGGCVDPLFGRPRGKDCSAIPDADSAICQAGRCVIESCARGFTNTGSACIKAESSGRKLSGYWAALEEASHVILQ